jgi:purine-binding chemotaxis protein CheW
MEAHVVIFRVANELYGIDMYCVQNISPVADITPVPGAPAFVAGMINQRGTMLPVIDLRERFGLPCAQLENQQSMMIIAVSGLQFGAIVDEVAEVCTIPSQSIETDTTLIPHLDQDCIEGFAVVDEQLLTLLNPYLLALPQEDKELQHAA